MSQKGQENKAVRARELAQVLPEPEPELALSGPTCFSVRLGHLPQAAFTTDVASTRGVGL